MRFARRTGSVIVYAVVSMTALATLAVLVIDWGRYELTRSEMRRIADAIATHSVAGIVDSTYLSRATTAAADNKCSDNGQAIPLQSGDVVAGQWNDANKSFTAGGSTPNAVRVTVVRSAARGNPMRMLFGSFIGLNTANLEVKSFAKLDGAMPDGAYNYGWIGINSTNFSTTGRIDSYASNKAAYVFPGSEVSIGTNGTHNINGNTALNGNANYGPSGGVSTNAPAVISGDKVKLNQNFAYSPYGQPGYTTTLTGSSGYTLSGGNLTINNGGVVNLNTGSAYSFASMNVNAGGTLNINGTGNNIAYIYVNNVNFNGRHTNNGSSGSGRKAINMILLMNGGGLNINAQTDIYGLFFGPNTPMNLSGTGSLYGFGIFRSMSVSGSASLHHDTSLGQIITSDVNKNIVSQWPPNPSAAGRSIIVQ